MNLDVFIRNVSESALESVVEEYQEYFIGRPVPLWVDNGTEETPDPELLGYHAKVKAAFYKKAKAKYPTKVYLYQDVEDKLRMNGCPMHVFGPGGAIETAIDTDDDTTFCRFDVLKDYAISTDRKKALKIAAGVLQELTPEEIAEKEIELDN